MDWHTQYLWWKSDVKKHAMVWTGAILFITSPIPLVGVDVYQRTTQTYSSEQKHSIPSTNSIYATVGMAVAGSIMMLYGARKKE